jgi:hypothetical protein
MENQPDRNSPQTSNLKALGLVTVILGYILGITGAGIGLGYYAWIHWGAPSWMMGVSGTVGLILAFYKVYQISQREL